MGGGGGRPDDLEGAAARLVSIRVNQRSLGRPPPSVEQLIAALVMRGWHASGAAFIYRSDEILDPARIPAEYQWNEEIRRSPTSARTQPLEFSRVLTPRPPFVIIRPCSTSFFFPA